MNTVLRSIGDAVIACNSEGHVVFMNGVAEQLTGWPEAEAQGHPLADVFHIINETSRQIVESPVDKVRRFGSIVGLANHTLLLRRDGSEISIDDSGAPIFSDGSSSEAGSLAGIVLVFRDITERRRAERHLELLAASGEAMATAFDVQVMLKNVARLCTDGFCDFCYFDLIDRDGLLQRATRVHRDPAKQPLLDQSARFTPALTHSGHPVSQAMTRGAPLLIEKLDDQWRIAASLGPEHLATMRALAVHSLLSIPLTEGARSIGAITFCRSASPLSFDSTDVQVGRELGMRVTTAIENDRLYRAVAEREASLQLALRSGRIGLWELRPATGKLVWSDRVREIFGLRLDEPITIERNFELLHPDDRERTSAVMNAALDPLGSGEYSADFRVVRPSGEIRWVSAQGRAFFEESVGPELQRGHVVAARFLGMVQDITETRQAEDLLRASEARFRALIENASVGIMIGDLHGGISYMNPSLSRLLGYASHEQTATQVRWDQITPAEYVELDRNAVRQLRETGTCEPYQKAFLNTSGVPIPLLLGATLLRDESQQKEDVAAFVTDLSGLRRTESALRESEKLAAVGRLAGSIAHEINNPLEAVTNLLYLMSQQLPTLELQQLAATAQEELARVSHIVTHTLRFHRQSTRPGETRIAAVVESVLALYRGRLLNAEISVSTRFQEAKPLLCYDGEVRQVLANLVGNAMDATPRGGRILVRVHEATNWQSGETGVLVTVADTGRGMSREILVQAFKAFFTTKGIGGTGLGLWISDEIIRKHQGRMRVRSREAASNKPGSGGTVFRLFLPFQPTTLRLST